MIHVRMTRRGGKLVARYYAPRFSLSIDPTGQAAPKPYFSARIIFQD